MSNVASAATADASQTQPLSTYNGHSTARSTFAQVVPSMHVTPTRQPVATTTLPAHQNTPPRAALNVASRLAAGVSPGTPDSRIFPISSLNPYQNRWTVRARISQKGAVRNWNNSRGEGKLFSFTLTDESGDIRVTCFKEEVDRFFDLVEINRVYLVSRGILKVANKQFNTTSHEYELTLTSDSNVTLCTDDAGIEVPKISFNFVDINSLSEVEPGRFVDVCGVAHSTGECETIMIRNQGREIQKREIQLVDASRGLVCFTLWGNEAVNFNGASKPVLVVKSAKVSDFNGRSLAMGQSSSIMVNPPTIPEASRLRGWYDREGVSTNYEAFQGGAGGAGPSGAASWRRLEELKDQEIGKGAKPDYINVVATCVAFKRENCLYTACPSSDCNKKVVEWNGQYRCEKCNKEYPNFKWRLMLQANLEDSTGSQWVTMFQDCAEQVLKTDSATLGLWRANSNETDIERVFTEASFSRFQFVLRAKVENYQDENRLKVVVVEAKFLSAEIDSARLIRSVESLYQEGICA